MAPRQEAKKPVLWEKFDVLDEKMRIVILEYKFLQRDLLDGTESRLGVRRY
jgi:hypothetical protein